MTAGSGILHIETPPDELVASGGLFHGVQLWVNLPRSGKLAAPRYQDIAPERIPVVQPAAYMVVTKRMKNMALSFTGDPAYVLRDAWIDG